MDIVRSWIAYIAPRYIPIAVFFFLSMHAFHAAFYLPIQRFGIISYHATTYSVNYFDHGFTKRGLVGSIVWLLPAVDYRLVAYVINVAAFLAIVLIVHRGLRRVSSETTSDILKAFIAISPFTAFQLGYELGRLDIISILLLLVALRSLLKRDFRIVLMLAVAGILTHEAFAVFAAPFLLAAMLTKRRLDGVRGIVSFTLPQMTLYAATCTAVSIYIAVFGNSSKVVGILPGGGAEAWRRPLFQVGEKLSWVDIAIVFSILAILYVWFVKIYAFNRSRLDVLFLSTIAPLGLLVLGWDYPRWSALLFVVMACAVFFNNVERGWIIDSDQLKYGMFLFLIPLGPVGFLTAFPVWYTVFTMGGRPY